MLSSVTQYLSSESATEQFAARLAHCCPKEGIVIFLSGELGAGKTTFVRGFLRALGHTGMVKSPTYTLVEPYQLGGRDCFHFDLYRIHSSEELDFIGLGEYFRPGGIVLVEWPERGDRYLPDADLQCTLAWHLEGRSLLITALSDKGRQMLKENSLNQGYE